MGEPVDATTKPSRSPWLAFTVTHPLPILLALAKLTFVVLAGALVLSAALTGDWLCLCVYGPMAGAQLLDVPSRLCPWYAALRHRPTAPEPPAPPLGRLHRPRWWDYASFLVSVGLLIVVLWGLSHRFWRPIFPLGLTTTIAGMVAGFLWWHRAASRYAPPPSALDRLRVALTKGGWPSKVQGVSDAGHAAVTFETSEGPELLWYINLERRRTLPPETVHLLWRHMEHYGFARAWIVTEASSNSRLAEYARGLNIVIATPEFVAAWGEPSLGPPVASPAAPVSGAGAAPPVPCPQFVPRLGGRARG